MYVSNMWEFLSPLGSINHTGFVFAAWVRFTFGIRFVNRTLLDFSSFYYTSVNMPDEAINISKGKYKTITVTTCHLPKSDSTVSFVISGFTVFEFSNLV